MPSHLLRAASLAKADISESAPLERFLADRYSQDN